MAIDYVNLLGLILVAVAAPLVVDLLRVPVPDAVAMILIGIAVGGSGLGWIRVDGGVELLAALGLAYLLFVAGLEVRIDLLRGPALATAGRPRRPPHHLPPPRGRRRRRPLRPPKNRQLPAPIHSLLTKPRPIHFRFPSVCLTRSC